MIGRLSLGLLVVVAGCGGSDAPRSVKAVQFVGFDASDPLVDALKEGKIQGLVVQDPYRMGELGVKTLVEHLEKKRVEPKIPTGETLVTPENRDQPEIAALLHPPRVRGQAEGTVATEKAKWRVMVIPKGTTHQFWETIHAGAMKAARELGNVEVIWIGPEKEDDRSLQINLVQNAVARRVDGIVLAPLDAKALVQPVEDAVGKGIPVVIIDSWLYSSQVVSYVATDNYRGGVLAARRLGEVLKGEGKIILLRYAVGSESTERREKGFMDTIEQEFPKISFLSNDQYAGATSSSAQEMAQKLVTQFRGRVDGVFCPNESSTMGMLRALEEAGMLAGRP